MRNTFNACISWLAIAAASTLTLPLAAPADAKATAHDGIAYIEEDTTETDTATADTIISEEDLPWPMNVQSRIGRLLDNDMFTTSVVGLMVYDLTADSTLIAHGEKLLLRPASTLKTVVAITALDRLGTDYQYTTRLAYTGEKNSTTLHGDIYCIGGFDPAFSSSDLGDFADSIAALGIDTIKGAMYADLSMKDDDRLGEGWCWDDDNPVLSPLLVGRKDEFAERLVKLLARRGIVVEEGTRQGETPHSAQVFATLQRPVKTILRRMLKKSDNLYSESLFYQLARAARPSSPATAKRGRQEISRLMTKIGLKPSRYYIADGSGLSLYNYVSAELETRFLRYAYHHGDIYAALTEALPIAGDDGTLDDRMRRGYAKGNVHAKTGTLMGISSLAGYCTAANGHVLCFAIINSGIRHTSSAHRFQDKVCEALCRP